MTQYTLFSLSTQTKCCSKGDQCLHPNGPNDLSFSEFAKNSYSKSGYKASCRECDRFNDHWRRVCPELSRDEALDRFGIRQKKLADIPPGMKRCTSNEKCLSLGGPVLDESEFYGRPDRNVGASSRCKRCLTHEAWCRNRNIESYTKSSVEKYLLATERLLLDIPDGYRICCRNHDCVHSSGPILPESEFRILSQKKNDGFSYACKRCLKAYNAIRLQRERNLGSDFCDKDMLIALRWFDYKCAYCNAPIGDDLEMDHFFSLVSGGATRPNNMIPSCRKCNNSKRAKNPSVWVTRVFGEDKAKEILARIQAFFETVRKE